MSCETLNLDATLYRYLLDHSLREHPALTGLRLATLALPNGNVQSAPEQVQFMSLLLRLMQARQVLEIGVFTGYATLAFALALPEQGRVCACDISEQHMRIGQLFWEKTGVAHKIDFRCAPALDTLHILLVQGQENFYDFAYIDADKSNYDAYYESCLRLVRPGGLIAIDNVLWRGRVAYTAQSDSTAAIQALNLKLHRDTRIDLSILPIGDGLALAYKRLLPTEKKE